MRSRVPTGLLLTVLAALCALIRNFVLTAVFFGVPAGWVLCDEPAPPPPDVILITLDTTRVDRLGCYGAKTGLTPNLDALAASGARFDRAQSPAPLTVPAHASMMTGLVPRRHAARDNTLYPLPADPPVLAELMAERGYDTAAFVSSVVLDRRAGLARGFRIYDDRVRVGRRSAFNYEERGASQTNDALFEQLDRLKRPFFLWVHYFDPHLPYVPPAPFDRRFRERPYDGEIAFMDAAIGRLLERVHRRSKQVLVVVAGDHGESLGDHGEASHGVFLYQSTQHVPLIFAGPGIPGNVGIHERVGLVDLMPTVLDRLGFDSPTGLDGRSLVPLFGAREPGPSVAYEMESVFPAFAYDWAPLHGLVQDNLVVIDAPGRELYDLTNDPKQTRNLWPKHARSEAMIDALRLRTADDALPDGNADEETAERRMKLESLGYVGGLSPRASTDPIDPKHGVSLLRDLEAARVSIRGGRPQDAIEPLRRLLAKNPGNLPARLSLVSAELGSGRPAAAVATARSALAHRPDDDLVRFNLANALYSESASRPAALREAREQYEHTLRLNPRRAEAYLNYASLLVGAERPAEARLLLIRAEAAGVEDPDIAIERGLLELLSGDKETAIRYFEQAVTLNPFATDAIQALERLRR